VQNQLGESKRTASKKRTSFATSPFALVAKAAKAVVDAGYGIKIEFAPRADAESSAVSAFDEWKRKRAR
jgi:hypothetical protein